MQSFNDSDLGNFLWIENFFFSMDLMRDSLTENRRSLRYFLYRSSLHYRKETAAACVSLCNVMKIERK